MTGTTYDIQETWKDAKLAVSRRLLRRGSLLRHLVPSGYEQREVNRRAGRQPIFAHPRQQALYLAAMRAAALHEAMETVQHLADALEQALHDFEREDGGNAGGAG